MQLAKQLSVVDMVSPTISRPWLLLPYIEQLGWSIGIVVAAVAQQLSRPWLVVFDGFDLREEQRGGG